MSEPSLSEVKSAFARRGNVKWRLYPRSLFYLVVVGILIVLFMSALPNVTSVLKHARENGLIQTARGIELGMFEYANDHDLNYPDGKSSTEVFQKLLDGGYLNNISAVYFPMAGKTPPVAGQPLKPENVCYDVTNPVDNSAPDGLPVVFVTGYKVNYVPGGSAVPLVKAYPKYGEPDSRTWWEKLRGWPPPEETAPGIAIAYKSGSATFMWLNPSTSENPDDSIPNFVPADFKPNGKTYRQLTPDGVLPNN